LFETGVELDAAIQRQVSFNDDIVVISKDEGNAKAESSIEPSPITTPAATAIPAAKLELTTKQHAINEQSRMRLEHERLANNTRLSAPSRLIKQNLRLGKM
jgi:hypothetical protein